MKPAKYKKKDILNSKFLSGKVYNLLNVFQVLPKWKDNNN